METILVTPLIGMGDTLMTTPALRLLKTRYPDWKLTYVTISKSNYELLKGNPFIDTLLYYPLKSAGIFNGPVYILNNFFKKFSISLTFYPANRAAYNLFALLTASPKRIGHTYLHANVSQLNWLKNQTIPEELTVHCVEENVRLLKFLGIAADNGNIPPMEIFLTQEEKALACEVRKTTGNRMIIGVHAGTSTFKNQNRRRWPQEKFAELINRFPDCHFALFGTKEEEDVNKAIQAHTKNRGSVSLIGNRPLREAIALIGGCDAFVSNDSGLMHIAAAMKVPTLALLGPTNQAFIYPWGTEYSIVRTGIECSPCFFYSPRPLTCPRHINFKCMADLSVEMAEDGLKKLLGKTKK